MELRQERSGIHAVNAGNPVIKLISSMRRVPHALTVSLAAAALVLSALPAGAPYLRVFQLVGATAFIGYAVALWQASIWYHRAWSTTIKSTIDGLAYALLTAGTFGWLWPR